MEGDNQENSIDSNHFGTIPLGVIVARAMYVCWPPWRVKQIEPIDVQEATFDRRRMARRKRYPPQNDSDNEKTCPETEDIDHLSLFDISGETQQDDSSQVDEEKLLEDAKRIIEAVESERLASASSR